MAISLQKWVLTQLLFLSHCAHPDDITSVQPTLESLVLGRLREENSEFKHRMF